MKILGILGLLSVLIYSPYALSAIIGLTGTQKFWPVFWGISYLLYVAGGICFSKVLAPRDEKYVAVIAGLILTVHYIISPNYIPKLYFLSHCFYGLCVMAITLMICRKGNKGK